MSTPEVTSARRRWAIAAVLVAGLVAFALLAVVAGLSRTSASEDEVSPATVKSLRGGLHRLQLSARAVERVGIATGPVSSALVATRRRPVVPYSAVIYDANGNSWTYISPKPRTYVRHRVVVDRVSGGNAFLSSGPHVGTKVVTVGAAELFGTEFEFDEE